MLRILAQRETLPVGIARQRRNFLPNFRQIHPRRGSRCHRSKRLHACKEFLQLGHGVGVAHAHVHVDDHLALEHVVAHFVHAEFLKLLRPLARKVQNILVGLVELLQQNQLAQDRRDERFGIGHQRVLGQHRGWCLQQGHRSRWFPRAAACLHRCRREIAHQFVEVGGVAVLLKVGGLGDVLPLVLDHILLRVIHQDHATGNVAHQRRQVHVLATLRKVAFVEDKLHVVHALVFDLVDFVLESFHQDRQRGRQRLVRLDHHLAHDIGPLAVKHGGF